MSYSIKLLPEARQDIGHIIDWYNEQEAGLGARFLGNLAASIKSLAENPLIFQIRYKKIRQAPVKDFPMQVHYLVEEKAKRVVILAVLHAARDPKVWRGRS